MKYVMCALLVVGSSFASFEEEAMEFQKILAFYKDQQYDLAHQNIVHLFDAYPETSYAKVLKEMLFHIQIKQEDFDGAIATLEKIDNLEKDPDIYFQYLDLLSQTKQLQKLIFATEKVEDLLEYQSKKGDLFFYKAIAYFDFAIRKKQRSETKELFAKIKTLLETPSSEKFQAPKIRILYEIEAFLENHLAASALAKKLAQHDEKFFFFHAYHLTKAGKNEGIARLIDLLTKQGPSYKEAALLLAKTWDEQNQLDQILVHQDLFSPLFDQIPTIEMLCVKAMIHAQQYDAATQHLFSLMDNQNLSDDLMRFACLQYLKLNFDKSDVKNFQDGLSIFMSRFPKDPQTPNLQYHLALLHKKKEQPLLAINLLENIYKKNPADKLKKDVLENLVELALHTNQNQKAYLYAKDLAFFTPSEKTFSVFVHTLHLIDSRQLAIVESILLEPKLKKFPKLQLQVALMAAKDAMTLKNHRFAQLTAISIIKRAKTDPIAGDAHFLLGVLRKDPFKASHHLEKTLEYQIDEKNQVAVWIRLFNIYNTLDQLGKALPKEHIKGHIPPSSLAAEYLHKTYKKNPDLIEQEHKIWLVNHFFNQLEEKLKALPKFKRFHKHNPEITQLLDLIDNVQKDKLSSEMKYEVEKKRAIALGWKGWHQEKMEILTNLLPLAIDPDKEAFCFYEIGSSANQLRLYGKAKQNFSKGMNQSGYYSDLCTLYWTRMHKDRVEMQENNLQKLKEITVKKSADFEPLFLEAGLEYIDISTLGMDEKQRLERSLFLYERFVQDFTKTDDPFSVQYQKRINQIPEKKKLKDAFITFAEYKIYLLQCKINGKSKDFKKKILSLEKQKSALSDISEVLGEKVDQLYKEMKRL